MRRAAEKKQDGQHTRIVRFSILYRDLRQDCLEITRKNSNDSSANSAFISRKGIEDVRFARGEDRKITRNWVENSTTMDTH